MKKLSLIIVLVLAGALLVLAGCGKNEGTAEQAAANQAAPAAQPAAAPADPNVWRGTVVETMAAGGYTYVLLDRGTDQIWAAGPVAEIAVGDKVVMGAGMAMPNFESKTLGRTFDVVYFVNGIEKDDGHTHDGVAHADHPTSEHPTAEHPTAAPPAGMGAAGDASSHMTTEREKVEGVAKAAGGQTVAEVFVNAASLKDKPVKVRGRVVKYSPNIMGVNWLHIQDGTGAEGTHDLTVTTAGTAKVGDVVLVEGPLSVDKDFGAGYRYAVIVENAKVTVE